MGNQLIRKIQNLPLLKSFPYPALPLGGYANRCIAGVEFTKLLVWPAYFLKKISATIELNMR